MKITILKQITSLLMILGLVGILVTSCEKTTVDEDLNLETALDNTKVDVLNSESLMTLEELVVSTGIKVESNQISERGSSCYSQYVRPAQLRWHGFYVTWYNDPTPTNKRNMDRAYCYYIDMVNYCNGTNYGC